VSINNQQETVTAPVVKVVTAWAAVGITSWADFAALLASIYTACLLGEWLWKKVGRPFGERHGWLQRKRRRSYDTPD
jgi:hypothetical protein